jgi:hypothetical protein
VYLIRVLSNSEMFFDCGHQRLLSPTSNRTRIRKAFETENEPCKGLDWELEDLLPEGFLSEFIAENVRLRSPYDQEM